MNSVVIETEEIYKEAENRASIYKAYAWSNFSMVVWPKF